MRSNEKSPIAAYQTGHAIAIYIAACAVISLVAAALMPDYTGRTSPRNTTKTELIFVLIVRRLLNLFSGGSPRRHVRFGH